LPAVCRTGVTPLGAHVREIVGTSRNPLSSRKPKWAPSAAVFFYARPHMTFPVPDRLFVALSSPFVGYLATPAHCPHQLPDIRYSIADAELPTNDLANAAQCPEVGRIAGLQRPLQKQSDQAFLLSLVQQGRSTRRWFRAQSMLALASKCLLPSYHRAERGADGHCHVAIRLARLQQANRLESTFLQALGCTLRSHDL